MNAADEPVPAFRLYPSRFPLKVFVIPDAAVEARIEQLFRSEVGDADTIEMSRRPSPKGKYLCLTLTFTATSLSHAEKVVKAVSADPAVVLAL